MYIKLYNEYNVVFELLQYVLLRPQYKNQYKIISRYIKYHRLLFYAQYHIKIYKESESSIAFLCANELYNKYNGIIKFLPPYCPVSRSFRIYRLLFYRGVRPPPISLLDRTVNLIVRFQWCLSFVECGAPLHCYSAPEWQHLIGPYLWVK